MLIYNRNRNRVIKAQGGIKTDSQILPNGRIVGNNYDPKADSRNYKSTWAGLGPSVYTSPKDQRNLVGGLGAADLMAGPGILKVGGAGKKGKAGLYKTLFGKQGTADAKKLEERAEILKKLQRWSKEEKQAVNKVDRVVQNKYKSFKNPIYRGGKPVGTDSFIKTKGLPHQYVKDNIGASNARRQIINPHTNKKTTLQYDPKAGEWMQAPTLTGKEVDAILKERGVRGAGESGSFATGGGGGDFFAKTQADYHGVGGSGAFYGQ